MTRSHVEQVHGLTSASVKALFSLLEQIYNRSKSPCLSISHHILFAHAVLCICVFHLAFTDIAIFTVTYKVTEMFYFSWIIIIMSSFEYHPSLVIFSINLFHHFCLALYIVWVCIVYTVFCVLQCSIVVLEIFTL